MMYNEKLAVAIKSAGKVLREQKDMVYIPFGSEYSIFITLQKNNYEVRNAFISLKIIKRNITVNFEATGLTQSKDRINVVQGDKINIRIMLYDPTNGSQLLEDAQVKLMLGTSTELLFNETSRGVYECVYSTSGIDAFIAPKTLTGEITIEKENGISRIMES